jgi:hypothetical protein
VRRFGDVEKRVRGWRGGEEGEGKGFKIKEDEWGDVRDEGEGFEGEGRSSGGGINR